ncbi:MAG: GTPase/DUF3482 domain-containing protein [Phycisphaerales bacterium]|nr:GTPase/DUF3482 domain-containing protein [Phycisphaerales bacterium]
MSDTPTIAVVGHANTGKTSILQTLLRQRGFGETSPTSGTTRQVEDAQIKDGDAVIANVLDTPGIEDAIGLRDAIEVREEDRRLDGRTRLDRFMASASGKQTFAPELAALRAAMDADVLLYAIDARDEPQPRHLDELAVLAMTAHPVIPVLNFVARPEADVVQWREACARQGLHATVSFDAVVFDDEGEHRLLEAIRTLLPGSSNAIDAWIRLRSEQRSHAIRLASGDAADLLVNAAAAVAVTEPTNDDREKALARATDALLERVQAEEARTRRRICERFGFSGETAEATAIEVAQALGGVDLLSQASLERAGLWAAGTGTGLVAAGAMVDLVLGGISLGGFTALGAVGAAMGAVGASGSKIIRRLRGQDEVHMGDAAIELLAKRQVATIHALLARGHAAIDPINIDQATTGSLQAFDATEIRSVLKKATDRAGWSTLSAPRGSMSGLATPARVALADDVAGLISSEVAHQD